MYALVILLTVFVGALSYYAFGDEVEETILYDLPEGEPFTICTQIFYMMNIMGCFCLQSQVIFNLMEKGEHPVSGMRFYAQRIIFV